MHHNIKNEHYRISRWVPLRLILALGLILAVTAGVGFTLDNMAIKDQEKLFTQQQSLQAKLAVAALGDRLSHIVATSRTLSQYILQDYIVGKRSEASVKKLFKIKKTETNSILLFAYFNALDNEIISSDITSPKLVFAHDQLKHWVDKYHSSISGMQTEFITTRPSITAKYRIAGLLVPVWTDNKFNGTLALAIDLDFLTEKYISPLKIGQFGSGFIFDGSGTVIFDHEKEILGQNIFELHKKFPQLVKLDSKMLHDDSGTGEYTFYLMRGRQAERKLIAWETVKLGDMKLIVAISAPESDATRSMTSIRAARIAMIGLFGLIIFGVVFFCYYYRSKQILIAQNNALKRKDQIFEAIAANVPGIIYKCGLNPPYYIDYISPKISRLTGYDQFDFIHGGMSRFLEAVHPDDRSRLKTTIADAVKSKNQFSCKYRIIRSDGAIRWVYEKGTSLADDNSIVGFILDITERKDEEEALQQMEQRYQELITNAPLGIFQTTPEGRFISANPQMAEFYGYKTQRELIKNITDISAQCYVSSDTRKRLTTILREFGRTKNFEAEHTSRDGTKFWASETITAVRDESGNIIRYDGFMVDISERKEHEDTMRRLAMYDSLTGLPNRVLFDDRVKQAIAHAKRSNLKIAVLYSDLDNFKQVNDDLGHSAGDLVLKEVAGRFSDCLRTSDTVSRIGGDEFIFILQDVGSRNEVEFVAQRIIDTMRTPFYLDEKIYRLGVSIGISIHPDDAVEKEDLVRIADEAMYRAKSSGKNNFSY